jgi:predicted MPP superfamily phosphohydrolase
MLAIVLLIAVLVFIWAVFVERFLFVIRKENLAILPQGSKPLTVLQIGDIHMAPWQKSKQRFIKNLAKLNPDIVVNTGDNLGHRDAIPALLDCLEPLLKSPGVFVNGSNDYYAPSIKNPFKYLYKSSAIPTTEKLNTEEMVGAFENAGWVNLNNKNREIALGNHTLSMFGLDDAHIGYSDFQSLGELNKNATLRVGVTHAPYLNILEEMTNKDAEVIFAGHTHGGQVRLPFLGALTTNSDLPTKYARGFSAWEFNHKQMVLSVVAGLGNSIFAPVRFFCLPEVRFITLLPKG